jgi:glucan biosynthesis protein
VIEFEGDTLAQLPEQRLVESNVEVGSGKLLRAAVDRTPSSNRRLFIDVEPESRRAAEIRAFLTVDGKRVSETFSIQLRP